MPFLSDVSMLEYSIHDVTSVFRKALLNYTTENGPFFTEEYFQKDQEEQKAYIERLKDLVKTLDPSRLLLASKVMWTIKTICDNSKFNKMIPTTLSHTLGIIFNSNAIFYTTPNSQ